jgi:hypothetical protein
MVEYSPAVNLNPLQGTAVIVSRAAGKKWFIDVIICSKQ